MVFLKIIIINDGSTDETAPSGFDLVGEESKGRPLKDFVPEFLRFKKKCDNAKIDIPFLFHCGETLSIGGETDGNLFDALLLGSKRIGHGFALPRHPYVMEKMKAENICVEVCPISNEILGLTPRMNGHAVYSLLANNVHCTVSTDNGTLFRYEPPVSRHIPRPNFGSCFLATNTTGADRVSVMIFTR